MPFSPPSSRNEFEIGIICALPLEYDAVCLVFDQFWDEGGDRYGKAAKDNNQYTTGRIGKYNIVLALLSRMGKVDAAGAAVNLRSSFVSIRLILHVGVCGVVPFTPCSEILLGDVIISKSVVQYDFGRHFDQGFVRKDTAEDNLSRGSKDIRCLLASLGTDHVIELLEQRTADFLNELQQKASGKRRIGAERYRYPGTAQDMLFEPDYRHKHRVLSSCICNACIEYNDPVCNQALVLSCDEVGCDTNHLVSRQRLEEKQQQEKEGSKTTQNPKIYIGAVASGDSVLRSARMRDKISRQENVIAFEMVGAGVWEDVPCIIVKGACGYADCHRSKGWQNFAAATAASAAKAILERYTQADNIGTNGNSHGYPSSNGTAHIAETAVPKRDIIRFGEYNRGSQTGINHGTINNNFGT